MKKFELPKIYPITDPKISGLSHFAQVERLIAGGATLIQLREKSLPPKEFYDEAVECIEFARRQNVKILINDRVDIALAAKADGVHLGQTDLPPDEARKILGDAAIIGFSTHNLAQFAAALRFPVDYLAVGPIFRTSTKEKPDAVVGLEKLREICQIKNGLPVVAIGGIALDNFAAVLASGADCVAVISAILAKPDEITTQIEKFNY